MPIRPRSALPRSDAVRVGILPALLVTLLVPPRATLSASQPALAQADSAPLAPSFVVGDGTAESCTELALRSALAAAEASSGGTIHFNCGNPPVTITVSQTQVDPNLGRLVSLTVPNRTTIDGSGLITLRFFPGLPGDTMNILVNPETKVRLKDLSIIGGSSGQTVLNLGWLSVKNITFSGAFTNGAGVANGGTLIVENSTFSGFSESAISNGANARVDHSAFNGNSSFGGGGAISNRGTLTVKNSIFSGNGALGGGAIENGGGLTIDDCEFSHNGADLGYGGAIANTGSLIVKHSTFFSNLAAGGFGGGISEVGGGTLTVMDCEFIDNYASGAGGGIVIAATGDTVVIERSTFSGNYASSGGGIYEQGSGTLTVSHSTITGNTAGDGGGIYVDSGTLTLEHSSVTGNTPNDISYGNVTVSL
jgi:predicted outer membrane repeat protein